MRGSAVLLGALAVSGVAAPTLAAGAQEPSLRIVEPGRGGLIVLPDGTLFLWISGGQMQRRDPSGSWSEVVPLGIRPVEQIVPNDAGFLARGTRDSPGSEPSDSILLVNASGAIVDRWELLRVLVFSIAESGGRRWATVTGENLQERRAAQFDPEIQSGPVVDRLLELLPASTTGEVVRTKLFRRGQAVACGSSGELLVGSTDVQALSLPDLKPLWRRASPLGRVVALASAHDRVWVATSSGRVASLDLTAFRDDRGSNR